MAKKITIQTELENFEDDWGGTYHTGEEQPFPDEVTLRDGQEWGHTRGDVERVIKANANKKYGAALATTDSSTLVVHVRFFATVADMELWQTDNIQYDYLVMEDVTFQGSQAPEGYTMAVNVTGVPKSVQAAETENIFAFTYNSYWGADTSDLDTLAGTAVLTVNGEVKERLSLASGGNSYSINVGQYILDRSNEVSITVSNTHGKSRTWNYSIEALVLNVSFLDSFINQVHVAKDYNWELPIFVSGVGGTVYVKVDNDNPQSKAVGGNAQSSFMIDAYNALSGGKHTIEVWAVDSVYGLRSSHIFTQFIKEGSSAAIALGINPATSVTMYDTVNIPYFLYMPSAQAGDVIDVTINIKDGNNIVSTAQQSAEIDEYKSSGVQQAVVNIMDNQYIGQTLTLEISVTGASTSHDFEVQSAGVILQEASECKVYYNLAKKTNSDADVIANEMKSYYNNAQTSRLLLSSNFRLNSKYGFHAGMNVAANRNAVLKDWKPFATDVGANGTQTGKTIEMEFETGVASDMDIPVISCMDNKCGFEVFPTRIEVKHAGSENRIITYFPDGERVKFSLVINGTTTECVNDDGNGNREVSYRNLAFLYVNGVMVRIFEYGSASWQQQNIKEVTFGSTEAELTVYSIRGYDKALSMKEIIDNYAYDTPLLPDKIAIAKRNNILLSDGQTVDPNKIPAALPDTPIVTWWVETLPSNKKDPRECKETNFVNPEWDGTNGKACAPFTAGPHEINGDGTSSNAYPLPYKNWAEKYKDWNGGSQGIITLHLIEGDELVKKYSITYGISGGETKYVWKVNFASSEGIFNILAMNMYQQLTLAAKGQISDLLSLQQKAQEDGGQSITFRKSLSGFPAIGLRKHTVNGNPVTEFLSIYNFINNKKTGSMFGMVDDYKQNQLWEIDENRNFFNTPMTEHTVVDGQVVESNGVRDSEPFYYARFPSDSPVNDGNDLGICEQVSQVAQANDEIKALRRIHNWLVSVNPNVAKRYYARYGQYRAFTLQDDGFTEITYGNETFTHDTPEYRAEKFIAEYNDNLHLNDCIFYFIFCTWIVGKDSMDKNMSLFLDIVADLYSDDSAVREAAKVKLRIMLRDTDTTNMFDNTGILMYKYWHEWNDTYNSNTGETGQITGEAWNGTTFVVTSNVPGSAPVFNGRLSGLWDAISQFVPNNVRSVYQAMRSAGLNAATFTSMYENFRSYWCEALYNVDGMGYANTGNLNMAYGDKLLLSKYFYKYRERYMDSKYGYVNNAYRVTMRFNETPVGVWLKHCTPIYASFSYGSGTPVIARSIVPNTAALLPCSSVTLQDAVCYINDADLVTDLGFYELSNGYPVYHGLEGIKDFFFTQGMGRLIRLRRFIWANTAQSPNTAQTTQNGTVDFSNMKMLRELVMTYCTEWKGTPEIGSEIIEKIDFRGTPISRITIPETETLTELRLPETITELRLAGFSNLENFSIAGVANITDLTLEDVPYEYVTETVLNAILTLIDNGDTPAVERGHVVVENMDNETFDKLAMAFGIEAFSADNPLYIECPDGVYLRVNKADVEGGDTVMLQCLSLPANSSTVIEYQMIENDEVVTPVEGIATSSGGTTLNTSTGELITVANVAETLQFRAKATTGGTTVYSDEIEVEIHVYTYPTALNISGDFEIRTDGSSTYNKSFTPASFTAQVKSVVWSLSGGDGKVSLASQSASAANISAMGVTNVESVATLTCVVTFVTGRTISQSMNITIQTMEMRFVDLGLPSGIKWANMNLGANAPEEHGLYFQWGDTVGYPTAAAMNEALGRTDGFSQDAYNAQGLNSISASLTSEYDAATQKLGNTCRMPTSANFVELNNNCTSVWTTYHGVVGRLFTSKINGKRVFFPASGRWNGTSLGGRGSDGGYWSSSFYSGSYAYRSNFSSGGVNPQYGNSRFYGCTVRAVQ